MKRMTGVACGMLAALAFPVLASAQVVHPETSKKADMHLTEPMIVGTQTLKPGEYRYQCITMNSETFLVITSDAGEEVARVPCTPEPLAQKAEISEIRSTTRNGKIYLTSVRVRGETVQHRVTINPGA
jgi:hypothetical protein